MATFVEVQNRLLRTINRPSSETDIVAEVKAFINDAILILQRDHAYSYTEGMFTFDYPASALFADIGAVCDASVRDYISLQQIAPSGTYEGKPLQMKSYSQLQTDRRKYSRSHSVDSVQIYSEAQIGLTVEDGYREDMIAFIMSKYMGLYPRPSSNTTFLLHVHFWLPKLEEDADSNFFLDYAEDLVVMLALRRMHLSMKIDSRWAVTDAEIKDAMDGLKAWDSQVTQYPGISIE
jgi:hypothetical protein